MRTRNCRFLVSLSDSEMAQLNADAKKAGISREAYLRSLIKKMPLRERPPMDLIEVLRSLQQINNNMNQIASKANSIGFVDAASYWENVSWLQKVVSQLLEKMF